jgi:F-type H+-transporting ATPase subunit gamma
MATRDVLRRQIQSTQTLRSVVQTMKALATVRIGQVRRAATALDASVATLELAFQALLRLRPDLAAFPGPAEDGPWAAIAVGSDHGLAGPFNDRLARYAVTRFERLARAAGPPRLLVAGRRLRPRLALLGYAAERTLSLPAGVGATDVAVARLLDQVEAWQADPGVSRVLVVHHRPTTGVGYRPEATQLLPLDVGWLRELRDRPWPTPCLPMAGVDETRLLRGLVRQHLAHVLARAFAASQAAENAARLAAMEAAERNVEERLGQLRHAADLERQNAVTAELLDVQAAWVAAGEG